MEAPRFDQLVSKLKPGCFRGTTSEEGQRRVIHPSHLKYQESRRMPYLAMVDRLREFLRVPTAALIFAAIPFMMLISMRRYSKDSGTRKLPSHLLCFKKSPRISGGYSFSHKATESNCFGKRWRGNRRTTFQMGRKKLRTVSEDQSPWINWACSNNGMHAAEFKLGDFAVLGELLQELVGDVQQQQRDAPNAQ